MTSLSWLLIPSIPLLAACVVLRWPKIGPWLWLTCVPPLVMAIWPPQPLSLNWVWVGALWGADDVVTRMFLAFSALLWGCAGCYAGVTQKTDLRRHIFWVFWLLSLSGNLLLIIAQDGASFYVGFTAMSLSAYGLVIHEGGPRARQAGRLYLQLVILGEMLLYAGLMLRVHAAGGDAGFAFWREAPVNSVAAALLLLGFGLKAGFWPLHIWLPLAHPVAPAAASAVLSGAMIKGGILGLWRFMPDSAPLLQDWGVGLFFIGLISTFYGVLLGLVQRQAKAVLAYSSVSQMGYLLMILALAWQGPDARAQWALLLSFYAAHHGLAKGALFMGASIVRHYRLRKAQWLLMVLPALALAGLPFTSGALIKDLLKQGVGETVLVSALMLGSIATAVLLFRALFLMGRSQGSAGSATPPYALVYPWALLCVMPLWLPWLMPELRQVFTEGMGLEKLWSQLWPIFVSLAVGAVALWAKVKIPSRLAQGPVFGRYFSLKFKYRIQHLPLPKQTTLTSKQWRAYERCWNRFWQRDPVVLSAWSVCLLLLLGWLC